MGPIVVPKAHRQRTLLDPLDRYWTHILDPLQRYFLEPKIRSGDLVFKLQLILHVLYVGTVEVQRH